MDFVPMTLNMCHICYLECKADSGFSCSDCGEFTCDACGDGELCDECLDDELFLADILDLDT